jgi:RNA methyltransferase, TrmH family
MRYNQIAHSEIDIGIHLHFQEAAMTSPHSDILSSGRNPLIKRVRGLARREARRAEGVVLVEGLRAVIEAIRAGCMIETLLVAPERLHSALAQQALDQAEAGGARIVEVAAALLDDVSERDTSQGMLAIVARPHAALTAIAATGTPFALALHEPQDPGNVGTIARTADAAGAAAMIILGTRGTDPFDPKAVRASMGSLFALPVIELEDAMVALALLQEQGMRIIGAAGAGTVDLWHAPLGGRAIILLGNERAGLPSEILAMCDVVARIPQHGRADSLNVASAAAIFAFEVVRQRS